MTEETDRPTITFEGDSYFIDELSDKAKYFTGQLQQLAKEINDCQSLNHRLELSRSGFIDLLRLELSKESEEIVEEPNTDD
jgi:hypothetical protein